MTDGQKGAVKNASNGKGLSTSPGIAHESGSQSSTTSSGVSAGALAVTSDAAQQALTGQDVATAAAALNRGVTTDQDSTHALTQAWNGQRLMTQTQAALSITSSAMPAVANAIGTMMDQKAADLQAQARATTDPDQQQALLAEAAKYGEGGLYRDAAHVALGGLGGGLTGAIAGGTAAAAAPTLNQLQDALQTQLLGAGMGDTSSKTVAQLLTGGVVAAVGAAAGGGAAAVAALNEDANNRQLHKADLTLADSLAAKSGGKYTAAQIDAALRAASYSDGKGTEQPTANSIVPLDDPALLKAAPNMGGIVTTEVKDGGAQWIANRDSTGTYLNQKLDNVDPGLARYILSQTGGANSPYAWDDTVLRAPTASSSTPQIPPAPAGTTRSVQYVDGVAYYPAYAQCPAASCQTGDPIAAGINDAPTQAYLAALAAKTNNDLNGASAVLGIAGAGLKAGAAVAGLVVRTVSTASDISAFTTVGVTDITTAVAKPTATFGGDVSDGIPVTAGGAANSATGAALREELARQAGIPRALDNVWGANLADLKASYELDGWSVTDKAPRPSSSGNAQVFVVDVPTDGGAVVKQVQFSPASDASVHGGQYYKFSYTDGSTVKVIDPSTYRVTGWPETNTTFYNQGGSRIVYDPVSKTWSPH